MSVPIGQEREPYLRGRGDKACCMGETGACVPVGAGARALHLSWTTRAPTGERTLDRA